MLLKKPREEPFMNNSHYTIGETAGICNISTKTLRHYDRIGLLKPDYVDPVTGYRYYTHEQIIIINTITSLKSTGLGLAVIKEYLENRQLDAFLNIMKKQAKDLEAKIKELKKSRQTIEGNIQLLTELDSLQNRQVELRYIPGRTILAGREHSPCNPRGLAARFSRLLTLAESIEPGINRPLSVIIHDHYTVFDPENADLEVYIEIKETDRKHKQIRKIPPGLYISTIHKGAYHTLVQGYKMMVAWTEENGYLITGPAAEIYHVSYRHTAGENNFITELQIPVKKA